MSRTPRDVTDAELAIMEHLWTAGPLPMRELATRLYNDDGPSACATVQKLLARLQKKQIVKRLKGRTPIQFDAAIERTELINRRLRDTAEKLCEGSLTPLLTQLVRATPFTDADRRKMLDLIEKLDQQNRSSGHEETEDTQP